MPAPWPRAETQPGGPVRMELAGQACLVLDQAPHRIRFAGSLLRLTPLGTGGSLFVQEIDLGRLGGAPFDVAPVKGIVYRSERDGMTLYWYRRQRPSMWKGYLVVDELAHERVLLEISVSADEATARRIYGGIHRCGR